MNLLKIIAWNIYGKLQNVTISVGLLAESHFVKVKVFGSTHWPTCSGKDNFRHGLGRLEKSKLNQLVPCPNILKNSSTDTNSDCGCIVAGATRWSFLLFRLLFLIIKAQKYKNSEHSAVFLLIRSIILV
jgi:hypothetical protein